MDAVEARETAGNGAVQMSDAKRALLMRRLRGKRDDTKEDEISRRPAGMDPLSFGQERLWFQSHVLDTPALFNIAFLANIEGRLDPNVLEDSVNFVIARHQVLRAGFVSVDGAPKQFFSDDVRLQIQRVDLSGADEDQTSLLNDHARAAARRPFDFATPPLIRATLFQLAVDHWALLFVVHHLVWDGWSSAVFVKDIAKLYQSIRDGRPDALPLLTRQYADFAFWQRRLMESEAGTRQLAYWRRRLEGLPPISALPTDRPRGLRQSHLGATHEWRMPPERLDRIAMIATAHNVTQFAVLLAAYNVLLMHYSGQSDIAIGTTIAYRTHSAFEKLIGFFTNALVLRTSLRDDPTFATLIERTHQTSIEAQSNQDVPFDMLVEHLAPKRGLSHNPLFQNAFVLHNFAIEELAIDDIRINFQNLDTGYSTFDMVLHIFYQEGGLKAVIEYDSYLFDAGTIESLAAAYDTLLDQLLEAPNTPISQARLLDATSEAQMRANAKTTEPIPTDGLLQCLADAGPPSAIAVSCGDERISYEELAIRSNRLAHHLLSLGVDREKPVAILSGASIDTIVAIIGILKAGGAYLPLDPSYPPARVRDILEDSGAVALVTTVEHAAGLDFAGAATILLDRHAEAIAMRSSAPPPLRPTEDNLAYLIYTSGSTGLSKGVMVSHRNAIASTRARERFYREHVSNFLLLSPFCFDSSVAGIFWTLAQSGTIRIATEDEKRNPARLAASIAEFRISHLLCLPSLLSAILDVVDADVTETLRCCIVAGEACGVDVAEKHFRTLPHVPLYNEYGPTECSVWSTAHEISHRDIESSVPIGRPIPGAQALVIGAQGSLLPRGAAGELCIAGAGVSRGYLGRPDLTAERFRPNPFGAAGERLYHSGDLARLDGKGELRFLGRMDDQVKIRGLRVDPREIESAILERPEVEQCIVAMRSKGGEGPRQLVAYYQTTSGHGLDEAELAQHLSERLPSFMLPDIFVHVPGFQWLNNGKIDRRSLPEPIEPQITRAMQEPNSVLEVLVADIWCEVLGVTQVNGGDNFFTLGGNSLAAIQVIARVQQLFGRDIPVDALFASADLVAFTTSIEDTLGPGYNDEIAAALEQVVVDGVA